MITVTDSYVSWRPEVIIQMRDEKFEHSSQHHHRTPQKAYSEYWRV